MVNLQFYYKGWSNSGLPTGLLASFVAQGETLDSFAEACGFTGFDWTQTMLMNPPQEVFSEKACLAQGGVATPSGCSNPIPALVVPPSYLDPPPGNYTYAFIPPWSQWLITFLPNFADAYPFYYSPNDIYPTSTLLSGLPSGCAIAKLNASESPIGCALTINSDANTLNFYDSPASSACQYPNSCFQLETQLIGICKQPYTGCELLGTPPNATVYGKPLYDWTWSTNLNRGGNTGGITFPFNPFPPPPDSGTGGVTITSVNGAPLPPALSSGNDCDGSYSGAFHGNIVISKGQSCVLEYGTVTGNVLQTGGSLTLLSESIGGDVGISGSSTFLLGQGTTINGNVGIALVAPGTTTNQMCGADVLGDVTVVGNASPFQLGSASSVSCPGNTIGGSVTIDLNTAVAAVYNNSVGKSLSCVFNRSISGGGNKAKQKLGQCAGF